MNTSLLRVHFFGFETFQTITKVHIENSTDARLPLFKCSEMINIKYKNIKSLYQPYPYTKDENAQTPSTVKTLFEQEVQIPNIIWISS